METFFQIIDIIIRVLNSLTEHNTTYLTYPHIAELCKCWNSTKDCYIFELNKGGLDSLYTPWGKQILNIPLYANNFITKTILSHFTYINIGKNTFLITHIDSQPIYYPIGITDINNYFIPNSNLEYIPQKQRIDNEIKRLVLSEYLSDEFEALHQLASNPDDYAIIIDIIGNQNKVSSSNSIVEEYMCKSTFKFLHIFKLIIMSQTNIQIIKKVDGKTE
jgi:hypothetical protein